MRKKLFTVAAALLAAASLTSCVGSFSLFNRVIAWENRATGSKIINEIIFLIASPVNGICAAADALVFNSIEFWSGANPIAQNVGKIQTITGEDGKLYAVKTLKNGYEITAPDGSKTLLIHNEKTNSWSQQQDGKEVELFRFNEDGTIQANINGTSIRVTANEAGLATIKAALSDNCYAMQ